LRSIGGKAVAGIKGDEIVGAVRALAKTAAARGNINFTAKQIMAGQRGVAVLRRQ